MTYRQEPLADGSSWGWVTGEPSCLLSGRASGWSRCRRRPAPSAPASGRSPPAGWPTGCCWQSDTWETTARISSRADTTAGCDCKKRERTYDTNAWLCHKHMWVGASSLKIMVSNDTLFWHLPIIIWAIKWIVLDRNGAKMTSVMMMVCRIIYFEHFFLPKHIMSRRKWNKSLILCVV